MSVDRFMACKGQFIRVAYETVKAAAAAHRGVTLTKRVSMVARAGVNYANLSSVREGIAAGERGEVQPLPWGEWVAFPYVIAHKGQTYFRLYPVAGSVPTVAYMVNGETVSREVWAGFLTPSERAKMESGDRPDCITVKAESCVFPDAE
jgi:hypothetical protein